MAPELYVPDYIRPLIAHRKSNDGKFQSGRFAGSCFFIDEIGTVLTCAHIIEGLRSDEELFSFDIKNNSYVPVRILHRHHSDDFAVCQLFDTESKKFTMGYGGTLLGRDVVSYGYLSNGISNGMINVDYRIMKGHVSRVDSEGSRQHRSNQVIEVSFPSLAGFSGAPIFSVNIEKNRLDLIGMLFGNVETSIEVFSHTEIDKTNSDKYSEKIHRILEYGVGHSVDTIVGYLKEFEKSA